MNCKYLREFSKKFEMVLMEYSGAGGKLIHEKNQKQKISLHFPFKSIIFLCTVLYFGVHPDYDGILLYTTRTNTQKKISKNVTLGRHIRTVWTVYEYITSTASPVCFWLKLWYNFIFGYFLPKQRGKHSWPSLLFCPHYIFDHFLNVRMKF